MLLPVKAQSKGSGMPRGIRNNNPGNIRISPNNWLGKVPVNQNTDGAFEQFTARIYGVRAMVKLIQNYISQGNNTIQKIISKWAPASENPTQAYISFVSQRTGINPNAVIGANANLQPIVSAISEKENGAGWVISPAEYNQAKNMT